MERERREGEGREGGGERERGRGSELYPAIHYVCTFLSSESHTKGFLNVRHMVDQARCMYIQYIHTLLLYNIHTPSLVMVCEPMTTMWRTVT